MLRRYLALGKERIPSAGIQRESVGELIKFANVGDGSTQELAIVAHHHHANRARREPRLEPGQAIEVEVVGGLIKQEHVEAGQQQRGQARPRCFAARQRLHGLSEQAIGQTKLGPHLANASVEVGRADGKPMFEGVAVSIVGSRG